eukprot:5191172-Amphidinium_carterae.2
MVAGYCRDVLVQLQEGVPHVCILINAAYHMHKTGVFVISLLRCPQPPVTVFNFSAATVQVAEPQSSPDARSSMHEHKSNAHAPHDDM